MIAAALSLLVPVAFGGCGSDSAPTVPAVNMVAGAMLPRTGPNANSDWISAVELAVLDVNNAAKAANMKQPLHFSIEERDTASNETMANAAMTEYFGLHAKVVITEASNAAIGSNTYNYE